MKPTPTIPANRIGRYLARHGGVVRDQAHCNYAVELPFHGDDGVRVTAWHRSLDPEGARPGHWHVVVDAYEIDGSEQFVFREDDLSGIAAALLLLPTVIAEMKRRV